MKPETISLLCRPGTHEPLCLASVPGPNGSAQEVLVGISSGETFRIRDGIPLLLDESTVSGFNQRYQGFYNRIAGLYDTGIKIFAYLSGGGEEQFRSEYLRELDMQVGDRALEVSIGTGANLHYLPPKAAHLQKALAVGCDLLDVPNRAAGQNPQMERPAEVIEAVRRFL